MALRHEIDDAIEEWRDQCLDAGLDYSTFLILYNPDLVKDLARHITVKLREKGHVN